MSTTKIGFIGGGNMARSIIGGLVDALVPGQPDNAPVSVMVSDPSAASREGLERDFGVITVAENRPVCEFADVLILAVKPQVMGPVCQALREFRQPHAMVISIAAGISCASLKQWLGSSVPVVRCMPNTPALVQCGATGVFATADVSPQQRQHAQAVLSAVGTVHWVEEESLIDAVTAVSGSGPAYFFLLIEAMTDAGVQLGLERETAAKLAIQTAAGAAKLAASGDADAAELRRRVSSPGGTTERAIQVFEQQGFRETVQQAMTACANRSIELARLLGD